MVMASNNTTWRDIAKPIIYDVLQANKGADEKVIRKALKQAYPFGQRSLHPYKIWCDEVRLQTKKKRPGVKSNIQQKEQLKLF